MVKMRGEKMKQSNITRQAYSEVYDIINHLEPQLYAKIPHNFINKISINRDFDYNVNIDYTKTINEQKLLKETRIILSLIYRDYLCTKEQREEIILNDAKELKEKYQINFKKTNNKESEKNESIQENNKQLIVIDEKWYKKILKKILLILKIK